jgi:NAD(P)-dependent dehydrogenase (short-subunit alcohol dehydrogenase family)
MGPANVLTAWSPTVSQFKGKQIVITGASRGIGYHATKLFLAQGAKVIGTARSAQSLAKVDAEFKALGDFSGLACDQADPAAPAALGSAVAKAWDHVDILVNNAAVQTWKKDWLDEGPQMLEDQLRINVLAPHHTILALLPLIKRGTEPRIINVSSGAGTLGALQASPDMPTYRLTKFTFNGLSILWAGELKGQVAVNALDPGWLKTDLGGPQAPGEPIDGGKRVVALAGQPFSLTGKFIHDGEIAW